MKEKTIANLNTEICMSHRQGEKNAISQTHNDDRLNEKWSSTTDIVVTDDEVRLTYEQKKLQSNEE